MEVFLVLPVRLSVYRFWKIDPSPRSRLGGFRGDARVSNLSDFSLSGFSASLGIGGPLS